MKRKIIQIANSTQLVSLPKKWCVKYGVKKGDEIEVEEQGNRIVICTDNLRDLGETEVDISGLDRDSLMYLIRFLYIKGYDEIKINYDKNVVPHFRVKGEVKVSSAIHDEVNRLSGFEIIQQRENYFLIKDISGTNTKDFDVVLRRILLLLIDASNDLMEGSKKSDKFLIESIKEKHDTITKFIANNLRILNKIGYTKKNNLTLYHILYVLDNIADIFKEASIAINKSNIQLSEDTEKIFQIVVSMLGDFQTLYFKFDKKLIEKISKNRYELIDMLDKITKDVSNKELLVLTQLGAIAYRLLDISVNRMMIEY